jgi:YVTN family beta-propeller protein
MMKRRFAHVALLMGLFCLTGSIAAQVFPYAYVANQNSSTVSVIDTATGAVVSTIGVGPQPGGVAVTHDGTELWVVAQNEIDFIDTATNTVKGSLLFDYQLACCVAPNSIVFSPKDKRAYMVLNQTNSTGTTSLGAVLVFERNEKELVETIPVGRFPDSIAINPQGTKLFVTNSFDGTVSVIDVRTMSVVYTTPPLGNGTTCCNTFGVAVAPGGQYVYVGSGSGVVVLDAEAFTVVTSIPVQGITAGWLALSPDGSSVYVTDVVSDSVAAISTLTNTVVSTIPGPACTVCPPTGIAVGPLGTYVYAAAHSGTVNVIDTLTDTEVESVQVGTTPVGVATVPLP